MIESKDEGKGDQEIRSNLIQSEAISFDSPSFVLSTKEDVI